MGTKGRDKKKKKGGGIAFMTKKNKGWEMEIVEIGASEEQEDILIYLVGNKMLKVQLIIICVYMTTGSREDVAQENRRKYNIIKKSH